VVYQRWPPQEFAMKSLIGAAVITGALVLSGQFTIDPAAADPSKAVTSQTGKAKAAGSNARLRYRHHDRYAYRPDYQPYYYDRPVYYRPYPYGVPVPFYLGFAYGPRW
jgi:hypothetical protein